METHNTDAQWEAKLATAVKELTLQHEKQDKQTAELQVANTELKRIEEKLSRVNRLYAFISQVNQKIARVNDEATIFSNVCTMALEFGQFKMAWIGLFDNEQKRITLAKHCGMPEKESRLFNDALCRNNNGPQDQVLRSGTYYICNDIEHDPELERWKPYAAQYGIRSAMVLPIKKMDIVIGTLNLYSSELNFSGREEIKLLVEVTNDISYALDIFEKEKQHNTEVEEIKVSEMLYHSLFDHMLEGFAHCKMIYENDVAQDFIYLHVNEAFGTLTGLKDVVEKKATEVIPGIKQDNPELFETYSRVALTGKSERFEIFIPALQMWLDLAVYSTEKGYFTAVFDVITEKKLSEEKLATSEKLFRVLIEKGADMKTLTDRFGKVLYSSPSITHVFGYTEEEFSHKYPANIIHPEELVDYLEFRRRLVEIPGSSFHFQQRRLHKNGTWIWCEGTITNMLNEAGVNALVSDFSDISERKEAEQQSRFDKNNLNSLINNTNDLMWSVDRDFNLITANIRFDEAMKLNSGNVIKKGSSVLAAANSPEMLSHFKSQYERAFAGEAFIEIEHFDVPFEFWTEISYYPIRLGGQVIGTACHSRDISERIKADRELLRSAKRLKEAQAISHISNWEIDLVTKTHIWSDEFYRIYGISKGDIEPSTEALLSFVHPDDKIIAQRRITEAMQSLTASYANFRFIKKDGAVKYGYIEWKFEFDKNEKPVRLYGILQDVTERKEAEEKIIELNEHLEKRVDERTNELVNANKALEAFSYSVSHDLRSPVRSVVGFAGLMKKKYSPELSEDANELLDHIQESGKRMNAIIDDLLSFAKWGKEKLTLTEVDMNQLFDHVWNNTMREGPHNAVFELQPLPNVQADRPLMRQVVINLISNAIKYSSKKEKPVVKVGFEETESEFIFHVTDNGAGFDMQHYSRLFGAFQRLHGVTDFEGTGIGLTLIKNIIEKHKGRVWAEGKVDEGATFWFSLPKIVNED